MNEALDTPLSSVSNTAGSEVGSSPTISMTELSNNLPASQGIDGQPEDSILPLRSPGYQKNDRVVEAYLRSNDPLFAELFRVRELVSTWPSNGVNMV